MSRGKAKPALALDAAQEQAALQALKRFLDERFELQLGSFEVQEVLELDREPGRDVCADLGFRALEVARGESLHERHRHRDEPEARRADRRNGVDGVSRHAGSGAPGTRGDRAS